MSNGNNKKKVVIKPDPDLKNIITKGEDTSGIIELSKIKIIKKAEK